jgi:hypothetical protein
VGITKIRESTNRYLRSPLGFCWLVANYLIAQDDFFNRLYTGHGTLPAVANGDARDVNPVQMQFGRGRRSLRALGDTKGLRGTGLEEGLSRAKFASAARGVLFWISLIYLKASENLVGVLAQNHPN